ncbi:MAG: AraC family transcriptional regulator [Porticoccaceae bacterium]
MMNTDSLPKPSTLEGVVELETKGHWGTLQINSYLWQEPRESIFKSDTAILNFVLARKEADLEGCYLEASKLHYRQIGDILLMPPDFTLHSRWGSGMRRSMCYVPDTKAFSDMFDIEWGDPELMASLDINNVAVRAILLRLFQEIQRPGFASDIMIESMCATLVVELYRYFSAYNLDENTQGSGFSGEQIRRIRERFEAGESPSVADLAKDHAMSIRHFSRLFRRSTGQTLRDFAASVQIERAKALLSERQMLIKQVAYHCGFRSTTAFSFAFRRESGLTPQQYRESVLH